MHVTWAEEIISCQTGLCLFLQKAGLWWDNQVASDALVLSLFLSLVLLTWLPTHSVNYLMVTSLGSFPCNQRNQKQWGNSILEKEWEGQRKADGELEDEVGANLSKSHFSFLQVFWTPTQVPKYLSNSYMTNFALDFKGTLKSLYETTTMSSNTVIDTHSEYQTSQYRIFLVGTIQLVFVSACIHQNNLGYWLKNICSRPHLTPSCWIRILCFGTQALSNEMDVCCS